MLDSVDIAAVSASVETRYGRLHYFIGDDPIGRCLTEYGEWAQAEIDVLLKFIGLGSVAVDVGANIGTHSLAFSRHVGPHGKVLSFEPQPAVFELLERNLNENGCGNVVARRAGAGRTEGEMLVPPLDYGGHTNVGGVALAKVGEGEGERTRIIALDDLQLEQCHLVKIDAEGMDVEVLLGMMGTVDRLRPVLYVECNTVDVGAGLIAALIRAKYKFHLARTSAYNPDNFKRNTENIAGFACESSLLCVPEEAAWIVPAATPTFEILPVADLQDLANHLLSTPRFGDLTPHDRDPAWLRDELRAARDEAGALETRCGEAEARRSATETRARDLETRVEAAEMRASELPRLEFREYSLRRQLDAAIARETDLARRSEYAQVREADLRRELEPLQAWAAELERRLLDAQTREADLEQGLEPLRAWAADLERRLLDAQAREADSKGELDALRARTAELERQGEISGTRDATLQARDALIAAMQASTSWRVTAPLRWVGGLAAGRARKGRSPR